MLLSMKICVLCVLLYTEKSLSQDREFGPCPDIQVQSNFDDKKFSGLWFEQIISLPFPDEYVRCSAMVFSPTNENGNVNISQRVVSVNSNESKEVSMEVASPEPGVFEDDDGIRMTVARTDFTNYAVLYACKDYTIAHLHILFREPSPPSPQILHKALQAVKDNNIPEDNLLPVDQENCPPLEETNH